jgi:hypothetical protein
MAFGVLFVIFLCALVGQQLAGSSVINATFYPLQIGTVLILVAYVLATGGAIYFLCFRGEPLAPRWQRIIPALGGALVCYTIARNVLVGHEGTYARLPYIEGAILLVGPVAVPVVPGLSARVRAGLHAGGPPVPGPEPLFAAEVAE